MPAHSSLKVSDSQDTLESSIVHASASGGFSALSLTGKPNATGHHLHDNTLHLHSGAHSNTPPQPQSQL